MSAIGHLPVHQQTVVRGQVRHHDGHFRGRRRRLLAVHEFRNRRARQRLLLRQQYAQCIVHQRLTLPRCQLQDRQIFLGRRGRVL